MNLELENERFSNQYICAEQGAMVDAIRRYSVRLRPSTQSDPHLPNPEQIKRQVQVKTLTLARWPEGQNKPFEDYVEPCGRCETWMAHGVYFQPDTWVGTLKRIPAAQAGQPDKHQLVVMQVKDRLPYLQQRQPLTLTPDRLAGLSSGPFPINDIRLSPQAQALFQRYHCLNGMAKQMVQQAAKAIQMYLPHRVYNDRLVGAAVLMSNGKIYAAPNFEFKGRWYIPPASLAATNGFMEIYRQQYLAIQRPHQPVASLTHPWASKATLPSAREIEGNTQNAPYIVGVVYVSNDPNFAPNVEDLTYIARQERGGSNIFVGTLTSAANMTGQTTGNWPTLTIQTARELHPYLKQYDPNLSPR